MRNEMKMNYANPFTNVLSIVITKCVILDNLSHTTKIVSFPATNSNFVMKSTVKYVHGFSNILFAINFSTSIFILFFIL